MYRNLERGDATDLAHTASYLPGRQQAPETISQAAVPHIQICRQSRSGVQGSNVKQEQGKSRARSRERVEAAFHLCACGPWA